MEEANTPWTGGQIQLVFGRITKLKATYARHHVTLREDEKVDLVVGVIEQSGLLANDFSEWCKKDKSDKTWDNLKAHFKRAAKDLKYQQSAGSSGFANAAQQELANMTADTMDSQATALVNANTLVEHSNMLCANYAKRIKQLEAQSYCFPRSEAIG